MILASNGNNVQMLAAIALSSHNRTFHPHPDENANNLIKWKHNLHLLSPPQTSTASPNEI